MPRYDYRCVACSKEFELTQTFAEAGTGICPVCSGKGQRLYHAVPVIYKGSGFYTTDYGRPKRQAENGSNDTADSKVASKGNSSSGEDSKTAPSEKSSETSDAKSEPKAKASTEVGSSTS